MFDLTNCILCPRNCGVDRTKSAGVCGAGAKLSVAKIMHHHWEEPCISGPLPKTDHPLEPGSGTIFFTNCPLGCVYCQNGKISRRDSVGQEMSPSELAYEMHVLEDLGMYNINLVSPTHFTPQIIEAVRLARKNGMKLPVVWNTGGYEKPETIEALAGTVDVFLTDFKYADPELAGLYSHAPDYPEYAAASLAKMVEITGECEFDERGMMKRGVIVRHLVLPGHRDDSMAVLRKIASIVDPAKIKLSLMAQYTPEFLPEKRENDPYAKIRRKITTYEYEKTADLARELGFDGYMQERSSATKKFTPDF
ncbi:MAG: radical SAM protein [Clostridia bacterium]|nr:radical SAM protein [Clostridia bacterium]